MTTMTHKEILDMWPNIETVAEITGDKHNTVQGWYWRSSIPSNRWVRLVEDAHDRDIPLTYKMLAEAIDKSAA